VAMATVPPGVLCSAVIAGRDQSRAGLRKSSGPT
jgi:hypothetical protein